MNLKEQILHLFQKDTQFSFDEVALSVFQHQAIHNSIYAAYLELLKVKPALITRIEDIPLAPISLFKSQIIKSGDWQSEKIFKSSGTLGIRSQHHIRDVSWYDKISKRIATEAGYDFEQLSVLGLLPSYLENGDSSLVHMVNCFAENSRTVDPFYLHNLEALKGRIERLLETTDKDILLFGVTFAMLDFAELITIDSSRLNLCFTGGMKNKRVEMEMEEVVKRLRRSFPSSSIRSEYGMTEMLSQHYLNETSLRYMTSTTSRILIKDLNDPRSNQKVNKTGVVGIMDLANVDSLSFFLTEDLGIMHTDTSFSILGRMSASDLRGCNLLYEKA